MNESNVFNMDCMEGMKQYPDKYFDLAIVDPPYGIMVNMNAGRKKDTKSKKRSIKKWDYERPGKEYFDELFRISKNQIIWGGELHDGLSSSEKRLDFLGQISRAWLFILGR